MRCPSQEEGAPLLALSTSVRGMAACHLSRPRSFPVLSSWQACRFLWKWEYSCRALQLKLGGAVTLGGVIGRLFALYNQNAVKVAVLIGGCAHAVASASSQSCFTSDVTGAIYLWHRRVHLFNLQCKKLTFQMGGCAETPYPIARTVQGKGPSSRAKALCSRAKALVIVVGTGPRDRGNVPTTKYPFGI